MITASSPLSPDPEPREGTRLVFWRVLLAMTAVFVLLFQLGGRGLNEPDEGRYAEAGREMVASGDYLTPRLNDVPHLAKPPLTYWLLAMSFQSLGPSLFSGRLVAALLGILQAGYYGVPQNRWRVFIVAAAADSTLPEFPLPVHAFPRTTIFGATAFRANVVKPPDSGSDLFWQPKPLDLLHGPVR